MMLRLRNQVINVKHSQEAVRIKNVIPESSTTVNGCEGVALISSRHNSSSATASPTDSVVNKMCHGQEKII